MNEREARDIMHHLLSEHKLYRWKITFNNRKKALGYTKYKPLSGIKEISLSRNLLKHSTEQRIRNTMLHEIAHALDFETRGRSAHDRVWKHIAMRVGASPESASYEEQYSANVESKYTLWCPNCDNKAPMFRRPTRSFSCTRCYERTGERVRMILKQNY